MIVICDASVIIVLAKLGFLTLLRDLFGSVLIPRSVYAESIVKAVESEMVAITLAIDAGWLRVMPDPDEVPAGPGRGERASLALASSLNADLVIIDDLAARRSALAAGFLVTGTVGVLRRAIDSDLISGGEPLISALVEAGFRATDDLFHQLG